MANLKSIFEIPTRPCWVDGRRAIFHRWTDSARPVKARGVEESEETPRYQLHSVHALVEYEDGTMERVWPNAVRFADSDELFAGYCWEAMEHRRDELPYTYEEPLPGFKMPDPNDLLRTPEAQEKTGQETAESNPRCTTCAHNSDNEEFCEGAGYDCDKCTVMRCICKRCTNCNLWEPKGGTV